MFNPNKERLSTLEDATKGSSAAVQNKDIVDLSDYGIVDQRGRDGREVMGN
jgi:hypothetical protein